jgi:hypothetical protein
MAVVLGLLALLLGLAVPTLNVLRGNRSVEGAIARVDSHLGRARSTALQQQGVRGLAFFYDPEAERVVATIVREVARPATAEAGIDHYLDLEPDFRVLEMPPGVMVFDLLDQAALGEKYGGFNDEYRNSNSGVSTLAAEALQLGPTVLFDSQGRLMPQASYAFRSVDGAGNATPMGDLIFRGSRAGDPTAGDVIPSSTTGGSRPASLALAASDGPDFLAAAGVDGMAAALTDVFGGADGTAEATEEDWLDINARPLVINRFNGTILEGQ